jgi:hypothetical protein
MLSLWRVFVGLFYSLYARRDNEVAPPPDCSMELPQMKAELEAAMWDMYSGAITTKMGSDIGIRVGCL